ncbi:unnamed protein product, partial [Parascedosporium putredinis]
NTFENELPATTPAAAPGGDIQPLGQGPNDTAKNTLWMGELEPWMDENFIKGVFRTCSDQTVNVKVIRDKNSGAGYCFVEFPNNEAATSALGLNGSAIPNSTRVFKLNWASGGGLVDRRDDRGPEYSIFVGDLGPEVNEYVLVALFQARFPSCKSAKIMTDAVSGQSRGYAVPCAFRLPLPRTDRTASPVTTPPSMMNNVPQQHMWPAPFAPPYGGGGGGGFNPATQMNQFTDPNNTTVFVGGLSGYVTEDELRSFFQGFGEITYVKIPPGKGCGFVQFVHRHAAEMAINQMQGYPIGNSRVRLSWGRSQNNSGFGGPGMSPQGPQPQGPPQGPPGPLQGPPVPPGPPGPLSK